MIFAEWNWDIALKVAHEEGLEDGMVKEKLLIAKNLLEEGATIEFVQRVTGLSADIINE